MRPFDQRSSARRREEESNAVILINNSIVECDREVVRLKSRFIFCCFSMSTWIVLKLYRTYSINLK